MRVTIYDLNSKAEEELENGKFVFSSSDDVSKILRGDYADDDFYFDLFHDKAMLKWKALDAKWREEDGEQYVGFISTARASKGS